MLVCRQGVRANTHQTFDYKALSASYSSCVHPQGRDPRPAVANTEPAASRLRRHRGRSAYEQELHRQLFRHSDGRQVRLVDSTTLIGARGTEWRAAPDLRGSGRIEQAVVIGVVLPTLESIFWLKFNIIVQTVSIISNSVFVFWIDGSAWTALLCFLCGTARRVWTRRIAQPCTRARGHRRSPRHRCCSATGRRHRKRSSEHYIFSKDHHVAMWSSAYHSIVTEASAFGTSGSCAVAVVRAGLTKT